MSEQKRPEWMEDDSVDNSAEIEALEEQCAKLEERLQKYEQPAERERGNLLDGLMAYYEFSESPTVAKKETVEQPAERSPTWLTEGERRACIRFVTGPGPAVANAMLLLHQKYGTPSEHCGPVAEQRIREDERNLVDQRWANEANEITSLRKRVRELEVANRLLSSHLPDYIQRMVDTQIELLKGDQQ